MSSDAHGAGWRGRPALVLFGAALVLRAALVLHVHATNTVAAQPTLDEEYYLRWAGEIANGDLVGTHGLVAGRPWILNPLYAYVIAPLVAVFDDPRVPVGLLNALLGAGAAGLAAGAASRHFGGRAAWIAGGLTAFAAPLAQLDAHVANTDLAAFLTAGACHALAPAGGTGGASGAHGPAAAGIWLGLGALARPVALLAVPLAAWQQFLASRRVRTGLAVVLAFAACAVPALARNRAVSGEWIVYTAAGGINVHLGNNPDARALRSMFSSNFRFHPAQMHEDARSAVRRAEGAGPAAPDPTPGEVGDWFWGEVLRDVRRAPPEALAFAAHKARWFFSPVEVPSSASFALDRRLSPGLLLAFVPTWLTASLALAGLWVRRSDPRVLLGPGALFLAHWAVTTLVFPLSHYRAPAIPAMAVLAAGAAAAWFEQRGIRRVVITVVAGAAAAAGALPPQPDALRMRDHHALSVSLQRGGDLAGAEREALAGLNAFRAEWGRECGIAWERIADVQAQGGRLREAVASLDHALALEPDSESARLYRASVLDALGDPAAAEADARRALEANPRSADAHARLGLILAQRPGREREARDALTYAARNGIVFGDAERLRRLGLLE